MFRVIEKLENKKKIKQTTQKKGVYYITQVVKIFFRVIKY